MAKRRSTQDQKKASPIQRILYTALILLVLAVFYALGIDLEELGLIEGDATPSANIEEVVPTASGEFYNIYFTQPINSRDESRHTGATIEKALIEAIDGTQRTIDAALFELNAPDTTAALVRALQRGVKVRILADDEHNLDDPSATIQEVIDAGAEVKSDRRSALMHNKFFIFDGQRVWTGSTNVTRNDIYNNNNNAMLIRSSKLVENFQHEFHEMFELGIFTRTADVDPIPNRSFTINGTRIETYFSPSDGREIESRLVELINNAQTSVRFMTFSFTLESVGTALINQHQKGLNITGVVETTGSLQGQLLPLACAGANVRQDGNPNILHSKVFIIDESIVVMGSFNFSASARDNNSENLLIIHNADVATAYTAEWQRRFDEGRQIPAKDLRCP